MQYAHNSKEKKDHEGAKNGFFVGKEIPDSDSSEEGGANQWMIVNNFSEQRYSVRIKVDFRKFTVHCEYEWRRAQNQLREAISS